MRKAIIIGLGLTAAGIGLFIAGRKGWLQGLEVFKPNYIRTS